MPINTIPYAFPNHGVLSVFVTANDLTRTWRNTIDMVWDPSAGAPLPTEPAVQAFKAFIKGGTRDDAHVSKMSLQPWSRGNIPFSLQGNIWEQVLNEPCKNWGTGNVYSAETSSGAIPLGEVCVMMVKPKFGSGGGKPGRLFLRNAIPNAWVTSDTGGPPTVNATLAPNFATSWNTFATTELGAYCEANPLPRFCIVHAAKVPGQPNEIDVFDTQMAPPAFQRLTMHDIGAGS